MIAQKINDDLIASRLPALNRYALYLTGNEFDADDLVQWTVVKAIELSRKEDIYREYPDSWMRKIMKYEFLSNFVQRTKVRRNSCEYQDYMVSVPPAQESLWIYIQVEKLIRTHKPHNQTMLMHFINGESWPKIRKATKDFKAQVMEVAHA